MAPARVCFSLHARWSGLFGASLLQGATATPPPCRVRPAPHGRNDRSHAATAGRRISSGMAAKASKSNTRHTRACLRGSAIPQGKIALGAIGQHFDRSVGARQPRGQPRQIAGIAALGGQRRHQRAQPRPGEMRVAIARIVGVGNPRPCRGSRSAAPSRPAAADAPARRHGAAIARAIAARPAMPLPRNSRINSVSAWSSRVCAVRIWLAP